MGLNLPLNATEYVFFFLSLAHVHSEHVLKLLVVLLLLISLLGM